MAETTSTKKLVPVQPAALRLPGRIRRAEDISFLFLAMQALMRVPCVDGLESIPTVHGIAPPPGCKHGAE